MTLAPGHSGEGRRAELKLNMERRNNQELEKSKGHG